MAVWIARCRCPEQHVIAALAADACGEWWARWEIRAGFRDRIVDMLGSGRLRPECPQCGADRAEWYYELTETLFASMAEAQPALAWLETPDLAWRAEP